MVLPAIQQLTWCFYCSQDYSVPKSCSFGQCS